MERKTTKFKYLLLIPALFLGLSVIAQKAEPVKQAPGKNTVQTVSNHRPANWQLEQELQGVLDGRRGEAVSAKPKPQRREDNPQMIKVWEAKKALHCLELSGMSQEEQAAFQQKLNSQQNVDLPSTGLAPAGKISIPPLSKLIPDGKYPTDVAYCDNAYDPTGVVPIGPSHFVLNNPGVVTNIVPYAGSDFLAGASWANGEWYCGTYNAGPASQFVKVNTSTGLRTVINANTGISITALAYDWTTSVMYALDYTGGVTNLYTIDIVTGIPTYVGNIGAFLGISMGCNQEGILYMFDIIADNLVQVDKVTAAPTIIGPVGFNGNYAQDMEFDNSDNTMYMAAFNTNTFMGELRTVNLATGATTLIGAFPGGLEATGFAIQNQPFITYPDDLGISALVAPISSGLLGANETVTLKIRNYGSAFQSNFPVSLVVDGVSQGIQNCSLVVLPGQQQNWDWPLPVDLSAWGPHTLVACTVLPNDQNTINDCKTFSVTKIMPTWTDTIWPQSLPYWTGTTNGTNFIESSLMKIYGGAEQAWAKFDISNIPDNTTISSLKYGYYVQSNFIPYFRVTGVSNDPMTGTPASVLNQITTGPAYTSSITNGYSNGWHQYDLNDAAKTAFSTATVQDWFAIGMYEYEGCCYYMTVEGWQETHRPYLLVTFGYIPGPNDVGVSAVSSPSTGGGLGATEPITVDLKNYGTATQTSIPVEVTITGPTGTQVITDTWTGSLAAGATTTFTFTGTNTADLHLFGNYSFHVCTTLNGDAFAANNCKNKVVVNKCPMVVQSIDNPSSGAGLTAAESFDVTLKNISATDLSNVEFRYTINGGATVVVNYPGPLAPNAVSTWNVGTLDLHLYGTYNLQLCPFFAGNTYPNDGCKSKTIVNSIPTVTDTFYPQTAPYWTGSTDGTVFTETSLIQGNSGDLEDGWAKYDINGMPNGVTINSINEHFYAQYQSGFPYLQLKRMVIDPMASTPSAVMSAIISGSSYGNWYDMYNLGWHNNLITSSTSSAAADLANQVQYGWFANGFYEFETYCSGCYQFTVEGWAENMPFIEVNYTPPIAHDIALLSIDVDPFVAVGPYTPKATVKNLGLQAETFTVTMDGPGYSSTKTVTGLVPGVPYQVTFDTWNAPLGTATLHCCVQLATDLNFGNNCLGKTFTVEAKLTQAYGYIAANTTVELPEGPIKFFLEHPGTLTSLAPTSSTEFISGGCWANGTWYGAEYSYSNNSNLWTINPNTGAMTLIGPMGCNVSGLTFDHTTGIMWAVAAFTDNLGAWRTNIYTVDMATGAATLVRECGPIGLAINLASSQQGMLFFAEITNDRLWAYDPLIDELELMGPLGLNLNYAQDAEFDKSTNVLYFAGFSSTGTLYTVNLATGAITSVGTFQNGAEVCGFAIPFTWTPAEIDMGAMWITHPTIGNLTNAEPVMVRVRNYGNTTVTDFNLTCVSADTTFSDSWGFYMLPPVDPGVYYDYGFIPVLDLSAPGSHCIKVWISDIVPATDFNKVNDTVAKCVNNISCGTIDCFENAIAEPEPCGNAENDGCFGTPNAFVDIANGETYCGTLWKIDTLRDTDWYRFTIGTPKGIAVKVKAEYNVDVILMRLPCDNDSVLTTKTITKCHLDSVVMSAIPAGQYAIIFAGDWIDFNTACNNNTKYTFSFEIRPAKYCVANSVVCDEFIQNVQVNTQPAFSNPSTCSPGGYKDYTNLTIDVQPDSSYNITVTNGLVYYGDQCGIWIDWNGDFDFYDINEKLLVPDSPTETSNTFHSTFTVPSNAIPGPTRLRVRICYTGACEPCGTTTYGEVEDYTIYVHANIPKIVTTVGSLTQDCPGTKVVPVDVQEFNGVFGFNLVLGLGGSTYLSYENVHPELATGTLTVSPQGGSVQLNWFSIIPANIGTGKLLDLVLQTTSGTTNLVWDGANSQFSSLILGVLPDTLINGTLTFGNCSDLSGLITYKHPGTYPYFRDSVEIKLYTGSTLAFTDTVDNTGHYAFHNLPNNTYTIRAYSEGLLKKLWGGGNATDALLILRHYVGMLPQLTGLNVVVADVNQSGGTPNAVDALAVSRRYVQAITSFAPAPDWYFEHFNVTIDGTANQVQNLYGLCAGDVNGSYTPINTLPSAKANPSVYLANEGTMYIDNQIVNVPVMVQNGMVVGAVSLDMSYPKNLDIVGVTVANSPENLSYIAKDGHLRLAWFSLESMDLQAGEVLLTLQVKANSISDKDMNFFVNGESVIANDAAQNYENASLMMPKLVSLSSTDNYSLSNFPNPFNSTTEISYSIAKSGFVSVKVYNVLGEEVATVVNADQKAGNYTVSFDGSKLPKGVYVYKLQINDLTRANSMVITQ